MKKISFSKITALAIGAMAFPGHAFAATKKQTATVVNADLRDRITGATSLGTNTPQQTIVSVINVALGFLAFIAVALMLYAGFTWMTAAGNEDKVATAKKIIISAVIGLAVILAAWGLTVYFLGVAGSATGTSVS